MTEEAIRRIVREEIAASPVIQEVAIAVVTAVLEKINEREVV